MSPALLAAIIAANTKRQPEQPDPEPEPPAQESEEDGGL
ncbi:hypothetical protein P9617_gp28 [Escherichia phage SECphi18]|nr:hypothetical protein P9617_gp28 [Escherichia phage SECphi18]